MVQRNVVWVRGYALGVEGDEDVDVGCRLFVFGGGRTIGREGFAKEGGDFVRVPGLGHGVGEVTVCST